MRTKWADATAPLVCLPLYGETTSRLMEEWHVAVRGHEFAVPVGFVSDGASVPRALRWLCGDPMERPRLYAALLHDWLYTTGVVSRAEADAVYYAMLRHFGYSPVDASVNYLAVRLFGSRHYGRRAA